MTSLSVEHISKRFGEVVALDDVSLEVEPGEFVALLGPSGCGKTTLLRTLAGYERADAGQIRLRGDDVSTAPPEDRNIGMVFQSYALFPHLSAQGNVEFGLRMRGVSRAERRQRAASMLELVGLEEHEGRRRPAKLSGGQQQRVALARALVTEPGILLLDEPFANLDVLLRKHLRRQTRALQRRLEIPTILVTHDQEEAFELADRVAVIFEGRIAEIGTPSEIYETPRTVRVAEFVGAANLFEATERGAGWSRVADWRIEQELSEDEVLMLRPEDLRPGPNGPIRGAVEDVFFRGSHVEVALSAEFGLIRAIWSANAHPRPAIGEMLSLTPTRPPRRVRR